MENPMKRTTLAPAAVAALALALFAAAARLASGNSGAVDGNDHEVWVIDQSDTRPDGGGTLYIYEGESLAGGNPSRARPEVIDLGGLARTLCLEQTGSAPRRPHMFYFNQAHTHVALAFVATGHVLFMDGATRAPLACIDVGEQAHAAVPSPDGTYAIVANQNGKVLQRIRTDYATNTFRLEDAATLNLATCTTPAGADCQSTALRPDNAPICAAIESTSRLSFVTLRGGGLFVVDATATPMRIVAEYDREAVKPNGCGAVQVGGTMYINSGGGTPTTPFAADLYAFPVAGYIGTPNPPNWPPPRTVFSHTGSGPVDSHGAVAAGRGAYLWVGDRAANRIVVVETAANQVAGEIALTGRLSGDPAPDLLDIAPSGNRVYAALRGPNPLSGNVPMVNNAVGSSPGLAILRVEADGRTGTLTGIVPITRPVDGVERADPHGVGVRRR
jgi:DNA-binding beta-propeller fold protein YncE